mmetsp:Transcript_25030/g.45306  ORF Transcript_25030/g.45306 Transcript_25030/m.45306 type:complete len:566 (-) Transcript_25030:349-2046(-)
MAALGINEIIEVLWNCRSDTEDNQLFRRVHDVVKNWSPDQISQSVHKLLSIRDYNSIAAINVLASLSGLVARICPNVPVLSQSFACLKAICAFVQNDDLLKLILSSSFSVLKSCLLIVVSQPNNDGALELLVEMLPFFESTFDSKFLHHLRSYHFSPPHDSNNPNNPPLPNPQATRPSAAIATYLGWLEATLLLLSHETFSIPKSILQSIQIAHPGGVACPLDALHAGGGSILSYYPSPPGARHLLTEACQRILKTLVILATPFPPLSRSGDEKGRKRGGGLEESGPGIGGTGGEGDLLVSAMDGGRGDMRPSSLYLANGNPSSSDRPSNDNPSINNPLSNDALSQIPSHPLPWLITAAAIQSLGVVACRRPQFQDDAMALLVGICLQLTPPCPFLSSSHPSPLQDPARVSIGNAIRNALVDLVKQKTPATNAWREKSMAALHVLTGGVVKPDFRSKNRRPVSSSTPPPLVTPPPTVASSQLSPPLPLGLPTVAYDAGSGNAAGHVGPSLLLYGGERPLPYTREGEGPPYMAYDRNVSYSTESHFVRNGVTNVPNHHHHHYHDHP